MKIPDNCSSILSTLMIECWKDKPEDRPKDFKTIVKMLKK